MSDSATHIDIRHLKDPNKKGYITDNELEDLGVNIRKYIAKHKEPFINEKNDRVYEWEDNQGGRFKVVATNKTSGGALPTSFNPTDFHRREPLVNEIITFYSDRNFKNPMKFENPKLNMDNAKLIDSQMPHPMHTLDMPRGERIANIDFSDKQVVSEIQKSVNNFVKDNLKDINVKDEILKEFDLKNVKTLAKGKEIELNEAQIKTLKKDIGNSQIKSINENKFYFDKVSKNGDKKRFFVDIDENGAVKVDGFSKADIDEIPVRKSAMDELIGKDKLKGMSFEEKAAYHNELDPIKKEKIVKTAELNRLKRAAKSGDKAAIERLESFKAKNLDEDGNIKDGLELC